MKWLLVAVVTTFALLSMIISGKLLGFAMIGLGLCFITLGIENKLKNNGSFTLIISGAAAILVFAISGYIFSNPFM